MKMLSLVLAGLLAIASPAIAMTLETAPSMVDGTTKVVVAEGLIEAGDADRFNAAIAVQQPDAAILVVTSPGGLVSAAVDLADAVKARSYSVVVLGECASACAQILFPAGEYSILTEGSLLGIHSCSLHGDRDDLCNDAIAKLTVANGFPYGTIKLFSEMYGPGDMKWMSQISARCFGFYRGQGDPKPIHGRKACVDGYIFTMKTSAAPRPFGPSFDCAKAKTKVEQLFCLDRELMQADSILGTVYDTALSVADPKKKLRLRTEQRAWIKKRNVDCETMVTDKLDMASTRKGAMCLYRYNEIVSTRSSKKAPSEAAGPGVRELESRQISRRPSFLHP